VVAVVVYRRRLRIIINLQSPFLRCAAATVTTSAHWSTGELRFSAAPQRHTAGTGAATDVTARCAEATSNP
jgi:hypothetical protein